MEVELFEASRKGCVTTLNTLIVKDPLILNEFWLTSSGQTPLHVSVSRGHLHFTEALLERKPELALELDSRKRLPLHLASAEGHTEIVKALLDANKNANFDRDQDGRIPLHYAAMRGRIDVVRELINTRLDSTGVVLELDGESSVLHLCVKYNHLEVLKLLIDQCVSDNEWFLNLKDGESGNTILHLAMMRKQIETVKYLLTIPKVKARANVMNQRGFTALEISKHKPKDDKGSEIRNILEQNHESEKPAACLLLWFDKIIRWLGNLRYQGNWVEETRGPLMVVATVITTMTFQPSIAPPSRVWGNECTDTNSTFKCEAGTSVLAKELTDEYFLFIVFNTTAFIAALSVVFLLISGFPLKNKVFMWILTFAMFTSLTFTALAYVCATAMMVPYEIDYYETTFHNMYYFFNYIFFIWIGFVAVVLGIHSIRLLALLVMKRHGIIRILASLKARISGSPNADQPRNGIQLTSTSV